MCQLFKQYFKNIINKFIYYIVNMIFITFSKMSVCNYKSFKVKCGSVNCIDIY